MTNAEHYINGKQELYQLPDWATTGAIPDDWGFLTGRPPREEKQFRELPKSYYSRKYNWRWRY